MSTCSVVLRRALLAGAAVTAAFVLSACGGTDSPSGSGMGHGSGMPGPGTSGSASAAAFNDADVTFAQMMIEHHRQAVTMAGLASTRAGSAEVRSLAATIKAAQQPEITTMTGWLRAWGKPVPMPDASDGMDMGDMGDGPIPGAMSDDDMARLTDARGAAFDKQFLTLMITHHRGAVTMARQETTQGSDADAKALAAKIVTDQQAEITTMRQLLTKL